MPVGTRVAENIGGPFVVPFASGVSVADDGVVLMLKPGVVTFSVSGSVASAAGVAVAGDGSGKIWLRSSMSVIDSLICSISANRSSMHVGGAGGGGGTSARRVVS